MLFQKFLILVFISQLFSKLNADPQKSDFDFFTEKLFKELHKDAKSDEFEVRIKAIKTAYKVLEKHKGSVIAKFFANGFTQVIEDGLQTKDEKLNHEILKLVNLMLSESMNDEVLDPKIVVLIENFIHSKIHRKLAFEIIGKLPIPKKCASCINYGIEADFITNFVTERTPNKELKGILRILTYNCEKFNVVYLEKEKASNFLKILVNKLENENEIAAEVSRFFTKFFTLEENRDLAFKRSLHRNIILYLGSCKNMDTLLLGVTSLIEFSMGDYTKALFDAGVLPLLSKTLKINIPEIQANSANLISNMAAEGYEDIDTILKFGLLSDIFSLLKSTDLNVLKEATYVIAYFAEGSPASQIHQMLENNVVEMLGNIFIESGDDETLETAMQAFYHILKQSGNEFEEILREVKKYGIPSKIKQLLDSENPKVKEFAQFLVKKLEKKHLDIEEFRKCDPVPVSKNEL